MVVVVAVVAVVAAVVVEVEMVEAAEVAAVEIQPQTKLKILKRPKRHSKSFIRNYLPDPSRT